MERSLCALPVALSLTLCVLGVHPAAGAPGTKAGFPVPGGSAGPATPGEQLWVKRYNGPGNAGNGIDDARALGVSPDGSTVFVTGESYSPAGEDFDYADYATVAHNASTGKLLWVRRYNGPGNNIDVANVLGVSPDGSTVFVTGASYGSTGSFDYATVAYDAFTGKLLWVKRYNGPGNYDDFARGLGVSPDGSTVFVTGGSNGLPGSFDYATVAYDAFTGKLLWVKRYNGPGDGARALGMSPDGSTVFVTGSSLAAGLDYATVAYDALTGAQLWVKRYSGPVNGDDVARALGVSPNGSTVTVTGSSYGGPTGLDYATVAYNASTGAQLWVSRYNGPGNGEDDATALGVSPDGSTVFVTGSSVGSTGLNSYDYATLAYHASTGAQLWVKRYDGPGNGEDVASALGVSSDGSTVSVTGASYGSTGSYDYATVAYEASTGHRLWVSRYNGPGNGEDDATALGVSPDGSTVFVTGQSYGTTSSYDYATVAYSIT